MLARVESRVCAPFVYAWPCFQGMLEYAVPAGVANVRQVCTGPFHSCVLTLAGSVACYGERGDGGALELGRLGGTRLQWMAMARDHLQRSTPTDPPSPLPQTRRAGAAFAEEDFNVPAGLTGVTQISCGHFHTCAIKTGGLVFCWGTCSSGWAGPRDRHLFRAGAHLIASTPLARRQRRPGLCPRWTHWSDPGCDGQVPYVCPEGR